MPVSNQSAITCLKYYTPVALAPIMMRGPDKLVLKCIKETLPPTLDTH